MLDFFTKLFTPSKPKPAPVTERHQVRQILPDLILKDC
jgi:hypothetical protein